LIALRIANGVTQTELAERLGVSASQVSRDERNEYYGVTVERAQRVVEALNESLRIQVENERQGHALSPFEAALTVGAPRFRQEASTNDVMGRISPQAYGVATAPSSSTHPHHVRLRGSSS
jgi:transcriptional regulator with XRE-family HTH domain